MESLFIDHSSSFFSQRQVAMTIKTGFRFFVCCSSLFVAYRLLTFVCTQRLNCNIQNVNKQIASSTDVVL